MTDTAYVVVQVSGSIDSMASEEFGKEVRPIVEQQDANLFLDLSCADYVNSDGLGQIIKLHKVAQEKSRRVVLISPAPNVLSVLRMLNLTALLPVVDNVDEAIAHVGDECPTR